MTNHNNTAEAYPCVCDCTPPIPFMMTISDYLMLKELHHFPPAPGEEFRHLYEAMDQLPNFWSVDAWIEAVA